VQKGLIGTSKSLYYYPSRPSAFSKFQKFWAALERKGKSANAIRALLEKQDAYTLHRTVRKLSSLNPYTVTNVMDVWECDLLGVEAYAKYNDNHSFIQYVIEVI